MLTCEHCLLKCAAVLLLIFQHMDFWVRSLKLLPVVIFFFGKEPAITACPVNRAGLNCTDSRVYAIDATCQYGKPF